MFGLLKRKLKEAIEKVRKKTEEKEEKLEEEKIQEEQVEKKEADKEVTKKEKVKELKAKEEKKISKLSLAKRITRRISREVEITEEDINPILWDLQLSLLQADVALESA
jgi:signal recognition particle GTPase